MKKNIFFLLAFIAVTHAHRIDFNNIFAKFERERFWGKKVISTPSENDANFESIDSRVIYGNEAYRHSNPWSCGLMVSSSLFPGLTNIAAVAFCRKK